MPQADLTIILGGKGFLRPRLLHLRLDANHLRMQLEASVDEVVGASFTMDVIIQAKHCVISTFQTFRGPEGGDAEEGSCSRRSWHARRARVCQPVV